MSYWEFEAYGAYSEARPIAYAQAKKHGREKPNSDDIAYACYEVGTSYGNYAYWRDAPDNVFPKDQR